MSARHLLITIDSEEGTCGECRYFCPRCYCALYSDVADDGKRTRECLAAERAHAEAIAQARREERARVVAMARDTVRTLLERGDHCSADALEKFAESLEREP